MEMCLFHLDYFSTKKSVINTINRCFCMSSFHSNINSYLSFSAMFETTYTKSRIEKIIKLTLIPFFFTCTELNIYLILKLILKEKSIHCSWLYYEILIYVIFFIYKLYKKIIFKIKSPKNKGYKIICKGKSYTMLSWNDRILTGKFD